MFSNDSKKADHFDYEGEDLEAMAAADKYYAWIAGAIEPYLGKNVVEVGAGVGSFSKNLLKRHPKTLTLLEPSKKTHSQLKKEITSNGKTTVFTINDYLRGNEKELAKRGADTFVYINVFEHIKDDEAELRRIKTALAKGGHVVIFVPALQKLYAEFDKSIGHYRRYDKKRLQKLCDAVGLEVVKIRYMDMFGILPWWASFVLMKRSALAPRMVKIYDTYVVPVIRTLENTIHAPVGKNVMLVAKKK